jgi:hypothetical protein
MTNANIKTILLQLEEPKTRDAIQQLANLKLKEKTSWVAGDVASAWIESVTIEIMKTYNLTLKGAAK